MAAEANLTHGLPLKSAAKKEVFRAFVRAGKHRKGRAGVKSSRDIAAALQGIITHQTVLEYMRRDFPAIHAKMRGSEESPHGVGGLPDRVAVREKEIFGAMPRRQQRLSGRAGGFSKSGSIRRAAIPRISFMSA